MEQNKYVSKFNFFLKQKNNIFTFLAENQNSIKKYHNSTADLDRVNLRINKTTTRQSTRLLSKYLQKYIPIYMEPDNHNPYLQNR